jgi:hypothetical protein
MFGIFSRYNKTNFMGGGLTPATHLATDENTFSINPNFRAPRRLDFRDMCIQTSNQASTPHCAGYATAGMIEILNWRRLHYPEQIDGDAIYHEAKKIDGNDQDGTSLDSAALAAINLNLIEGKLKFVGLGIDAIKYAVHTNLSFVAGFYITNEWNVVNKKTGKLIDYGENAKKIGGHAVLVCGYGADGVYIQNSWGQAWGVWGYAVVSWEQVARQYMYGMIIV